MISKQALYMREWTKKNSDKKKANDRRFYQKNANKIIKRNKIWAENNPEKVKGYKEKYDSEHQRIRFKNRRPVIPAETRKGVCSKCGKSIKKGEIKVTNLHHKKYDESDPLAHTIELCVSCHTKLHANKITL